MKWHSRRIPTPSNWQPMSQLRDAGLVNLIGRSKTESKSIQAVVFGIDVIAGIKIDNPKLTSDSRPVHVEVPPVHAIRFGEPAY